MSGFGGGGSGFEAEAGGGNPTGYSESGGTVTLNDSVVIDGGGGSTAGLTINDAASNADVKLYETSGQARLEGAGGVQLRHGASLVLSAGTTGITHLVDLLPYTAGGQDLGTTALPFGSLTLGDATAQVLLGHDGATDGLLRVSDPNGVAGGAMALRNAAGSANTVYAYSVTGNGALVMYDSAGNYRTSISGGSGGGVGFGSNSVVTWSSNALAGDSVDTQIARASAGVVAIGDGTTAGGLNLLTAAGASGLSLLPTGYHMTAGTGQALALRGGTGAALQLYDGSAVSRFLVESTRCATVQTTGDVIHEFQNQWVAKLGIKSASQELTALSGASASTTNLVPAGCTILYVVARVTTLITGATTFDVGDGTDVDRYGAAIAVAAGTTVDETDGTADPRSWSASAQDVTLTANGSNFTAGAVRITAFYLDPTAPTS